MQYKQAESPLNSFPELQKLEIQTDEVVKNILSQLNSSEAKQS